MCELPWEDLETIGSLPHLETLELGSVEGAEWSPIERQFRSLKGLVVQASEGLIHWNVDDSHFPVLQDLQLCSVPNLEEVPLEIGEISTLEQIFLDRCKVSAAISAMKLVNEQESNGNEGLLIFVTLEYSEFELFHAWLMPEEAQELATKNQELATKNFSYAPTMYY